MKSMKETWSLNNGVQIPCLGFGTYKAAEGSTSEIIKTAIRCGYRYLDTASFYETETYVGEAVAESGIRREEFFLVSKVWKDEMGYDGTLRAFERTLENLGTDYLDLYLIHWPKPSPDTKEWKQLDVETWKAMEKLYREKRVRAIGVSNFLPHHIENLLSSCEVVPAVDQLEFHPGYSQEAAVCYCQERGILVQAWSPLGRKRVMDDELVEELQKYVQAGYIYIPAREEHQIWQGLPSYCLKLMHQLLSRLKPTLIPPNKTEPLCISENSTSFCFP